MRDRQELVALLTRTREQTSAEEFKGLMALLREVTTGVEPIEE